MSFLSTMPRISSKNSTFHRFAFHGGSWEYFLIWLSNIGLTILTLGLYSPWAKVRREQYFMRNTTLDGAAFDYLASPVKILKGRLIALLAFLVASVATRFSPKFAIFSIGILALLYPWMIVKSLQFRARYVTYRNLHFTFVGKWFGAFMVFVLLGLLNVFTGTITYPLLALQKRQYMFNNLYWGKTRFQLQIGPGALYRELFKTGLVLMLTYVGLYIFFMGGGTQMDAPLAYYANQSNQARILNYLKSDFNLVALIVSYIIGFVIAYAYIQIAFEDIIFNNICLGKFRLNYVFNYADYLWLKFSNFLLRVFTFGLGAPFAMIRLYRFRVNSLDIRGDVKFEEFIANQSQDFGALGSELASIYDADFDFGF